MLAPTKQESLEKAKDIPRSSDQGLSATAPEHGGHGGLAQFDLEEVANGEAITACPFE